MQQQLTWDEAHPCHEASHAQTFTRNQTLDTIYQAFQVPLLTNCLSNLQGLTDLITETEDGVSPMTYIRSLYPRDWDHFLERMGARLAGIEPSAVRSP